MKKHAYLNKLNHDNHLNPKQKNKKEQPKLDAPQLLFPPRQNFINLLSTELKYIDIISNFALPVKPQPLQN